MLHIVIKKPAKPGTRKVKWTLQKHTFEAILNFEYKAFTILPCCFVMSCWEQVLWINFIQDYGVDLSTPPPWDPESAVGKPATRPPYQVQAVRKSFPEKLVTKLIIHLHTVYCSTA